MRRKIVIFHSPLSPAEITEALRGSVDDEQRSLFSLSGFQGDRPLIGTIGFDSFRIQKRKLYRNDFARHFYAQFGPEQSGTRIEGYFAMAIWVKLFMLVWISFAIVIGSVIFIATCRELISSHRAPNDQDWVGLLVPPGLVLFGFGLPVIGSLVSRPGERYILQRLGIILSASATKTEA
jgi:hypothetical protein